MRLVRRALGLDDVLRPAGWGLRVALGSLLLVAAGCVACSVDAATVAGGVRHVVPLTSGERKEAMAWWPTKPADPALYAGTGACAECHADIVAQQAKSQMFRTFGPAAKSAVLNAKIGTYRMGEYGYEAGLHGQDAEMSVADAHGEKQSVKLEWYIGSGDVGQSYLWQDREGFRETRFNYFHSLDGLGATPGRLSAAPTYFKMAVGRPVEPFEVRSCLSCHTTQYPGAGPILASRIVGGIQCEACHGPGLAHIRAAREHAAAAAGAGAAKGVGAAIGVRPADGFGSADAGWELKIFNAARLDPVSAVDGCGACHGTPADVELMGATGLQTVRFPAYRLEKSRCWGESGDKRLICSSCHDPHAPIERDPAAYDVICEDCHTGGHRVAAGSAVAAGAGADRDRAAAVCPVAKQRCVTCHMPKYLLPEMHSKFTDHMIRIQKSGERGVPD